jgi:hypothetical protein
MLMSIGIMFAIMSFFTAPGLIAKAVEHRRKAKTEAS